MTLSLSDWLKWLLLRLDRLRLRHFPLHSIRIVSRMHGQQAFTAAIFSFHINRINSNFEWKAFTINLSGNCSCCPKFQTIQMSSHLLLDFSQNENAAGQSERMIQWSSLDWKMPDVCSFHRSMCTIFLHMPGDHQPIIRTLKCVLCIYTHISTDCGHLFVPNKYTHPNTINSESHLIWATKSTASTETKEN